MEPEVDIPRTESNGLNPRALKKGKTIISPLLVASNHPGAFDSLAILSRVPRKDIKVFVSDVPFTRAFLIARQYFIYLPIIMPAVIKIARQLLADHMASLRTTL